MLTLDLWTRKSTANEPHHAFPGPASPQPTNLIMLTQDQKVHRPPLLPEETRGPRKLSFTTLCALAEGQRVLGSLGHSESNSYMLPNAFYMPSTWHELPIELVCQPSELCLIHSKDKKPSALG